MSSPQKIHADLSVEIEKRIHRDSPVKYDVDFYVRKIARLENQYNFVNDELAKVQVKLRRTEDFEIKHDLLLKQNSILKSEQEKQSKELYSLKEKNEYLKSQLQDKNNKGEDWSIERRALQDQIDKWKNKAEEAEDRRVSEVQDVRQKCEDMVKREQQMNKREFAEREEEYQFKIRQMGKVIHEKETVENVVHNKVSKIRQEKDEEIARLGKVIEKQKKDHINAIHEKNEEFDKMREKFERMFNFQIQNLKKNLEDQDELFSIELSGLREMITLKNDEIAKLLEEMKRQSLEHEAERDEHLNEIKILKEKIYEIERQNEMQLVNLKERLTKIHSLDISSMENRYQQLIKTLKTDRNQLNKIIKEKDKMVDSERKEHERVKQELTDRIKERESRISDLMEKLKTSGDMNASEMKNLHESFHKIETEKESMTNQYQANVGFLNQQIAKLTSNNELKNNQIKQLHQEMAHIKDHYSEQIKDLELRWKDERKQRQEERQKERERRERMEEDFRIKERQWKMRERQLEREKQKQEREKSKLKFICQELEKDIQRLNQYIKQLDESLKKEYKKNQVSTLDNGSVRRELTGELEKQKNDLEAIKRMEVDQIRKKFEIEVSRLSNQNQKLQTDLLNKEIAFEKLQNEFKKLEHVNKNIDRINKQKLIEYQKKMATLNNEINLTQNLYQSFIEAKSRAKKEPK